MTNKFQCTKYGMWLANSFGSINRIKCFCIFKIGDIVHVSSNYLGFIPVSIVNHIWLQPVYFEQDLVKLTLYWGDQMSLSLSWEHEREYDIYVSFQSTIDTNRFLKQTLDCVLIVVIMQKVDKKIELSNFFVICERKKCQYSLISRAYSRNMMQQKSFISNYSL